MGSCDAEDCRIVKNWRENPPSSYAIKFNNLSEFKLDKFESRSFLSFGHNWTFIIYPKGNEKENGKGFISMYVEKENTSGGDSTSSNEVFANLIFFIYNKKQNKYFTIQDVEVKRFNGLRTTWGLSQVLSIETFNDIEEGFIFEGEQCEFGVDVRVATPLTLWEVVSFNEKLYYPKFSWSIKDFPTLIESFYVSKIFSMGKRKWDLKLHPKGDYRADEKWLSLFLELADRETLKEDEKIYVRAQLQILDPHGSNHSKNQINNIYTKSSHGWGIVQFMCLDKLREAYLDVEDTLNVGVEFEVVSSTKYSYKS